MEKFIPFFFLFSACTFSVNQIHTKGTASDVVDENQTASPNISPTIDIPLSSLRVYKNGPIGTNLYQNKPDTIL